MAGEYRKGEQFLFEAERAELEALGLSVVDSLVSIDEGGVASLPLCNYGECVVSIPQGVELGRAKPFQEGVSDSTP